MFYVAYNRYLREYDSIARHCLSTIRFPNYMAPVPGSSQKSGTGNRPNLSTYIAKITRRFPRFPRFPLFLSVYYILYEFEIVGDSCNQDRDQV